MADAWDAWFDQQYDLCRDVQQRIDQATLDRPPSYRAALYSALIESLAERMRADLELADG